MSALSAPLEVPDDLTGARIHFMARELVIARGHAMGTWERDAA